MDNKNIRITGFMSVFESKLEKLIKKIKSEYEKPKKDRNKSNLKKFAQEAKELKKLIKQCREQEGSQSVCCPKCKHEFELAKNKNKRS